MHKTSMADPLGGNTGDPGAPTINMKNINGGLPDPAGGGGPVFIRDPKSVL
jgi:hypothetical protein